MADSYDADENHYIRKKEMSAVSVLSSLRQAVFKETEITLLQVSAKRSTILFLNLSKSALPSPKKVWNVWNIFYEEQQNNTVIPEMVHEKLGGDENF